MFADIWCIIFFEQHFCVTLWVISGLILNVRICLLWLAWFCEHVFSILLRSYVALLPTLVLVSICVAGLSPSTIHIFLPFAHSHICWMRAALIGRSIALNGNYTVAVVCVCSIQSSRCIAQRNIYIYISICLAGFCNPISSVARPFATDNGGWLLPVFHFD